MGVEQFPPSEVAEHLLIAAACGLLVGLERQWSHKELGVRTFTIVSLLGALAALISQDFTIAAFVGVLVLIVVAGWQSMALRAAAETTTSAALMVTFAFGVLAGQGHVFTPAASVILMTLLLSLKPQFSRFTVGLTSEEVRGAVLLALIAFVIYPVLPNRFVDPWQLFNPREAWLIIVLIAAIGFVNYVLLRVFSERGLYYTAIFGGLVNSSAAIVEISALLGKSEGGNPGTMLVAVNLLTLISMFARNLFILAVFNHAAGLIALWPIAAMTAASVAVVRWQWKATGAAPCLKLTSPFELSKVARFGLLFLGIQIVSTLGQRMLGGSGLVLVSLLGGLASSASSTAAAATLAAHGSVMPRQAAICAVGASIASMTSNLPIVYRQFRDVRLIRKLVWMSAAICALGLAILFLEPILTNRGFARS